MEDDNFKRIFNESTVVFFFFFYSLTFLKERNEGNWCIEFSVKKNIFILIVSVFAISAPITFIKGK